MRTLLKSKSRALTDRLTFESLEHRAMLAADLSSVPLWDGETAGLETRFGGGPGNGMKTFVSAESEVVQSGNGSYRVNVTSPIPSYFFDFVPLFLTGFGPTSAYVDTRDLSGFESARFQLKNESGSAFRLVFEIKDYRDSNAHRLRWSFDVSANSSWNEYTVPLDPAAGWAVIGSPDLSRTKLFAFVIETDASPVAGPLFIDEVQLIEPGGALDPQSADIGDIMRRVTSRQFSGLWGSRDRTTGLVPAISAHADVMGLNTTSGVIQLLPTALGQQWVTQVEADEYVESVVDTLNTVWDSVQASQNGGYLPPRYIDRFTLAPTSLQEESPVDASFMFLALYQYQQLSATPTSLQAKIQGLLERFNFSAFASPGVGWSLAYRYATSSFTTQTYDGYTGEVYLVSLAAHLAPNDSIGITTHWDSGQLRVLDYLVDPADSHLVHELTSFRAPFTQWLFPLFVDVSNRGVDSYPEANLARNPYWNAVAYQRDVHRQLIQRGRPTYLQADAADNGTGQTYAPFSAYESFGEPDLFMPWSVGFSFLAEAAVAEPALRHQLSLGLHGPFGMSDSVTIATGSETPSLHTPRNDLWNTVLSTLAFSEYLYDANSFLTSLPAVDAALDLIFDSTPPTATISINGGAATTNSPSIVVSLTAADEQSGVAEMRYAINSINDDAYSDWEPFSPTRNLTLNLQDTNWVNFQIRDHAGNVRWVYDSIIYDQTAPTATLHLNGEAAVTNSPQIVASLTASDNLSGPLEMRYAINSTNDAAYSAWEPFASTSSLTLNWEGTNWVNFQIRDQANNVRWVYDSIVLDQTAPTATMQINGGAAVTNTAQIALALTALDNLSGVAEMRFAINSTSENPYSDWEPFALTKNLNLNWEGTNWINVQIKDRAGNVRWIYDSIVLDQTAPTATMLINGGAAVTHSRDIVVSLTASDQLTTVTEMRFAINSTQDDDYSAWQPFATTLELELPNWQGTNWVNVQIKDEAGNVKWIWASIVLDS